MEETDDATPMTNVDPEMKELLGLFDLPAFARRGQDLEYALARLDARCRRERDGRLDMVRVRLRQWAGAVEGPGAWESTFATPIEALWVLSQAEPPAWAETPAPPRRRRAIARDLIASVERFNRRWTGFIDGLNPEPINCQIELYNRYYVLEKECSLGSARLAARHFSPKPQLTREGLLGDYPVLPVPELL